LPIASDMKIDGELFITLAEPRARDGRRTG
jgi:hypothetical protein